MRRRRSAAQIEQLVADYEGSGLSGEEFCRGHGLSRATLARYRKRRAQTKAAPESRWLAVEWSGGGEGSETGAGSGLAVAVRGGRRVEVGCGFDAGTLTRLLSVLERC